MYFIWDMYYIYMRQLCFLCSPSNAASFSGAFLKYTQSNMHMAMVIGGHQQSFSEVFASGVANAKSMPLSWRRLWRRRWAWAAGISRLFMWLWDTFASSVPPATQQAFLGLSWSSHKVTCTWLWWSVATSNRSLKSLLVEWLMLNQCHCPTTPSIQRHAALISKIAGWLWCKSIISA